MRRIISFLLATTTSLAFCDSKVFLFVVQKSKLTGVALTNYNTLKSGGIQTDGQPALITQEIQPGNTNYFILKMSTATDAERIIVQNLIAGNVMRLMQRIYFKDFEVPRIQNVFIPPDLNRNYWIEQSTP